MMIQRLGFRMATSAMASSRVGKAIMMSVKRMSSVSTQPPKKPASAPTRVPMATASKLASTPTIRLTRAP